MGREESEDYSQQIGSFFKIKVRQSHQILQVLPHAKKEVAPKMYVHYYRFFTSVYKHVVNTLYVQKAYKAPGSNTE